MVAEQTSEPLKSWPHNPTMFVLLLKTQLALLDFELQLVKTQVGE